MVTLTLESGQQTLLYVMLMVVTAQSLEIMKTFRDLHGDKQFQSIIVHQVTGDIYVGGVNALFHFRPDLTKIEQISMGPRNDSMNCPPPNQKCSQNKKLINSFSEGVAIDYERGNLIACYSFYQGSCEIRKLSNIFTVVKEVYIPIVPNNPVKSSLIFTAPFNGGSSSALYVGSSYSNFGDETFSQLVPHISTRRLSDLEFTFQDDKGKSAITILPAKRKDFPVEFVYGFSYNHFAYFIVTQPQEGDEYNQESKIIRICEDSKYFNSYVEISIVCKEKFNFAKGAYFEANSRKLYVIFEDSELYHEGPSALCGFNMADTEHMFDLTVKECYEGDGILGPPHIHHKEPCQPSVSITNVLLQSYKWF